VANGPDHDRPQPTRDAAWARARAEERTLELTTGAARRSKAIERALPVLVAMAVGFGLGLGLTSGRDDVTSPVTQPPEAVAAVDDLDRSTQPIDPTGESGVLPPRWHCDAPAPVPVGPDDAVVVPSHPVSPSSLPDPRCP